MNYTTALCRSMGLFLFLMFLSLFSFSQNNFKVTGKVTNETGKPVLGATVQVQGTTIATATATDGSFSLMAPSGSSKLVITSVGFAQQEVAINNQPEVNVHTASIASSLQDAINKSSNRSEVFIVGGGELFKQALPLTHTLYLTRVHHTIDADVFFPAINMSEWDVESEEPHEADEKHKYAYTFFKLVRK